MLEAPSKYRRNYQLFNLHPAEGQILSEIKNKRRNFVNPRDPYFLRCSQDGFDRRVKGVYRTEGIISVMNQYGDNRTKSTAFDVRRRSQ